MTRTTMAAACAVAGLAAAASAGINYSGGTYSENFDTLASSGSGVAWTNDGTISGWHLFRRTAAGDPTPVAIATYGTTDGATTTGSFYSFGSSGSGERALGGLASGGAYFGSPASGAVAGWIALSLTNTSGGTMTDFTISFNGEQWRNGGNATAQSMVLEYGFGVSFNAVTTWTAPGGLFNWTSPVATTTAAAVDGNAAGLVSGRGGTVSSLTWNNGDTLWVRWIENNDAGNDHGLGIDNVSFSAVPTPGSLALLGLGALVAGRRRR